MIKDITDVAELVVLAVTKSADLEEEIDRWDWTRLQWLSVLVIDT